MGSRLKTPTLPIWVTRCNDSYGILFNPNRDLIRDYHAENKYGSQSVSQLISHSQSVNQSINQSVYKSVSKSDGTIVSKSFIQLVSWKGSQ